jgi:hypothetical protein
MPKKYGTRRHRSRKYYGGDATATMPAINLAGLANSLSAVTGNAAGTPTPTPTGTAVVTPVVSVPVVTTSPLATTKVGGSRRARKGTFQQWGGKGYLLSPSEVDGDNAGGAAGYVSGVVGSTIDQQNQYFDKAYMKPGMTGGKRGKKRRGGNLGSIISQAVVPFALLGAQNMYSRRRSSGKGGSRKTKKGGSRRRRH